jgi:glycosyltransferase involved in cell wall biosynthesis
MDLLYVIYTYNRPKVLGECLRSLFANNDRRPDRVVIIDDGSQPELKNALYTEAAQAAGAVDFLSFKPNIGYGRAAEIGFAVADMYEPQYCYFIESDYIFRKHGLDEVQDVLSSDLGQTLAGVAGYSCPDFFKPECIHEMYPRDLKNQYGQDNLNRAILFKPFGFQSRFGELQLQYTSNSCGTMYLNWRLISEMRRAFYPRMETQWIDAICCKGQPNRLLSDGHMSHGLAYFWMEYARQRGWDTQTRGALIDIMPSVANHLCAGGINGAGWEEGQTFVGSPSFPVNYNDYPIKPG